MRVKIVVDDYRKGRIEIPLTHKEVHALYKLNFMLDEDIETLKCNNIYETVFKVLNKFLYLSNDILYDGAIYTNIGPLKNMRFKKSDKKFYLVKKPKWTPLEDLPYDF